MELSEITVKIGDVKTVLEKEICKRIPPELFVPDGTAKAAISGGIRCRIPELMKSDTGGHEFRSFGKNGCEPVEIMVLFP